MVQRLLFTTDGCLRTNDADDKVLARVAAAEGERADCLVSSVGEHQIVPTATSGWQLELRDAGGSAAGAFLPFRLRRGGRLLLGGADLSLHGRPSSHDGWSFLMPDGETLRADVIRAESGSAPAARTIEVALEAERPLLISSPSADVLALGCWLITCWHEAPAVDHLLCSAIAGTGFAGVVEQAPAVPGAPQRHGGALIREPTGWARPLAAEGTVSVGAGTDRGPQPPPG